MGEFSKADAARAIANPLRAQILDALDAQPRSPISIAQELGVPLANVSHHVIVLRDLGVIELTGTRPRRGATEHFYRARWRVRLEVEPVD